MKNYIRFINYKKMTGEILSIESGPYSSLPDTPHIGSMLFPSGSIEIFKTHYVLNNELIERPQVIVADKINLSIDEKYIFENIPKNTKIKIFDIEEIIQDGFFEISFLISGTFDILIKPPFPCIEKKVIITVEDK